ncbi:MAG: aminotransferase class V-fold PLP-dependent enzyme [Acidobacteria bacterium]|nr:aminotransferase class V-fold PLP-dependent enzyme [Acidobacteriota bacterium]
MDAQEFRRYGYQLIDWVADYREGLERLPVMSQAQPGEVRAALPDHPPQHGGRMDQALAALDRDVMPGITHWNHPSFFAYFPSNTSYASILADIVASGLGVQGMSWQTSPAATEVEEVVMDWLRQMVGLPATFTGVIHDTASTATFTALLCAREQASAFSQNGGGLQGLEAPLMVYASDQGHSSIEKAALLAGFGKANLRLIPTDNAHALRLDLLEAAIAEDLAAGRKPCALVACIGTTGTTAVDPLAKMAELASKHGLWLHVDAAMAGTAMVLPECRPHWAGVERADSLVFNPHKWMGVGFDFSAYYVRDPQHLIRVMSTNPSYLQTKQDGEVKNFRDWHIQLGRRFRSLKLWFYLMDVGVEGLQARLRRDLANAQWLKAQVEASPEWELMAPVDFQTVCLRHVPPALQGDEAALKAHNLEIARKINEGGEAYLTPSLLKGRQILRVSIGAETTGRAQVEALWALLNQAAKAR